MTKEYIVCFPEEMEFPNFISSVFKFSTKYLAKFTIHELLKTKHERSQKIIQDKIKIFEIEKELTYLELMEENKIG